LTEDEYISVKISRGTKGSWEALAEKYGWDLSKLISFVIEQFMVQDGTVFCGRWKEKGEDLGKKVIIDWPTHPSTLTKAGIMNVTYEEMK
jgi:hypothetical protein